MGIITPKNLLLVQPWLQRPLLAGHTAGLCPATRTPQSLSTKLFHSQSGPSLYQCRGGLPSQKQDLAFVLAELYEVPGGTFFHLVQLPLYGIPDMETQLFSLIQCHLQTWWKNVATFSIHAMYLIDIHLIIVLSWMYVYECVWGMYIFDWLWDNSSDYLFGKWCSKAGCLIRLRLTSFI